MHDFPSKVKVQRLPTRSVLRTKNLKIGHEYDVYWSDADVYMQVAILKEEALVPMVMFVALARYGDPNRTKAMLYSGCR